MVRPLREVGMRPSDRLSIILTSILGLVGGCSFQCNLESCADGCCGSDGLCWIDGANDKCGLSAAACVDCTLTGQVCSASTQCVAPTNGSGSGSGGTTGGTQCLAFGDSCAPGLSQCCSGYFCSSSTYTCSSSCASIDADCNFDSDCCSGNCDPNAQICI
jgi:hypothetical protein